MAVYQLFTSADATLYSNYPSKNTGRDPILEVSVDNSQDGLRFLGRTGITKNPYYTYDLAANSNATTTDVLFPTESIRRAILQFSPADITKAASFASQSISGSWKANLVMYLATAQNLNTTYSLQAYALSQSWAMGTGQFAQVPESRNGVNWVYTGPYQASPTWNTQGGSYNPLLSGSQFFDYMSNKDINMDISTIMGAWMTGSANNYGLIVKHPDYIEQNTSSFVDLKFFSVDTHTIYPPNIQFKWADAYYYPQGTNYVLTDQITVTLANNPGIFRQGEVYKVRTAVRYTYPPRTFSTQSAYLDQLYLSENTCWSLQDIKTNETVIDFDPQYTKLSADSIGNYFTLYTSGLEINRYYRILIKTNILSAEEVIYTGENLVFKIVG